MSKYKVWTLDDIKEVLNKMSELCGLELDGIEVKINGRLTRTLGSCSYITNKYGDYEKTISIEIAKRILLGNVPEHIVEGIIQHEYMHYYCNETEQKNCGHNSIFYNYCVEFGLEHVASDKVDLDDYLPIKHKYEVTCTKCSNKFYKERLDYSLESYTRTHICGKCTGKLKIKKLH